MTVKKKRVVVSGMGLVSCFGVDVDFFYDQLLAGVSGVKTIENFPVEEYPTRFAAPVAPFDSSEYLDRKQARRVDPFIRFAVVAGKKALEMSGMYADQQVLDNIDQSRCGVLIGSGMGGLHTFYEGFDNLFNKGFRRISPFFIPFIIPNMAGAFLAIDLGFSGPNYSISTACATANYAIVAAAEHIRRGEVDVMLCGGSEASMTPMCLAGFVANKALSQLNENPQMASRPWDKQRDGFVLGEGSGVLVLESLDHALCRGAPIIAEYLGGAINADAFHMTAPLPDGSGVAKCMELAMADASVSHEQVDYINAHATSTLVGDIAELKGIHRVFGQHAKNVKMNATKSMVGHCLGAAGGIEAIATLQAIKKGEIHPTLNLQDPEVELGEIDPVIGNSQQCQINVALSNSFGFGGHNSTLVFAPYKK